MRKIFRSLLLLAMSIGTTLTMTISIFAEEGGAGAQANPTQGWMGMLIYFALIIGFFYLILYRPQKKKMKQEEEMRDSVAVGDKVIMSSGIIGKVINIKDNEVTIETGAAKTQIKFTKSAIGRIEKASDPVAEEKNFEDKKAELQRKKEEKAADKEEQSSKTEDKE